MHGSWTVGVDEYARAVDRYHEEVGQLEWAAPQDWMCEPWILAKTGLTVRAHQELTIENFGALDALTYARVIPVLQGWTEGDYFDHVEMYTDWGYDLTAYPVVGLGSVCRRQSTPQILHLADRLMDMGIRLHGFGVKRGAIRSGAQMFTSMDSMAWSYDARRARPLDGCTHRNCANCPRYAQAWLAHTLAMLETAPSYQRQLAL